MTSERTKRWLASTEGRMITSLIVTAIFIAIRELFGWTTMVVIALAVVAVSVVVIAYRRRLERSRQ